MLRQAQHEDKECQFLILSLTKDETVKSAMLQLDRLINLVTGVGDPIRDKTAASQFVPQDLSAHEAIALYRSSWMARAIVDEPAHDMTRAWRTWEGSEPDVAKMVQAEQALNLRGLVHNAIQMARLVGSSAIYVGTGRNSSAPLGEIIQGGIQYLHVFHGDELVGETRESDLAHPNFGRYQTYTYDPREPGKDKVNIHHSRLICFKGASDPCDPAGGISVLHHCRQTILDCETLLAHILALVGEAKIDVIKVQGLAEKLSRQDLTQKLSARFSEGLALKSILGVTLIGDGEEWDRKSVDFAHLEGLANQRLKVVSAAARMPATKLLGQSPAGMNATGESDLRNYYDMISGRQETGLRTALAPLDALILAHAGSDLDIADYSWNSVWQVFEKDKAANA